jgi:hypothetical protein
LPPRAKPRILNGSRPIPAVLDRAVSSVVEHYTFPKESDFPPGTVFVVKDGRDPFAMFPGPGSYDERLFSFCSGKKSRFPSSGTNLGDCSNWPVSMPFAEWIKVVEECAAETASRASGANEAP